MKKSINFISIVALLVITLCFAQCKKEKAKPVIPHIGFSIKLSDKPLDTIKFYILGNWKFEHGAGGIGNTVYYPDGPSYKLLTSDNRIKQTYKGIIITDTTIEWHKERVTYTTGDSSYTMKFYNKQNVPWVFVIDGISNDTLKYHDNSDDAMFYYYTKYN